MRVTLLQINPTIGDLSGNAAQIVAGARDAASKGSDLVVTPELALVGYPPGDLLLQHSFVDKCQQVVEELATELVGLPPVLVGTVEQSSTGKERRLWNTAMLLENGAIVARLPQTQPCGYDLIATNRYFTYANNVQILELNGHKVGIVVGGNLWSKQNAPEVADSSPLAELAQAGATYIVNMSAWPFTAGEQQRREQAMANAAKQYQLPILYVNQVGGNDSLVFAGRSTVIDAAGTLVARGQAFAPDYVTVTLPPLPAPTPPGFVWGSVAEDDATLESDIWRALVLGTRDYVHKCGMQRALLGLSGGIDSALVAAVATEALGPENVLGVLMPSPFSSPGSIDDALELAANLGIKTLTLPIAPVMEAYEATLAETFKGTPRDVTEENLQARIRGTLLMALSNKRRALLLSTGNKSEVWVGYCTLYGDTNGALAVIADVPKTMVYRICQWLNQRQATIPQSTILKAPSAELRPNQTDQDSLPPYDILDQILAYHIEQHEDIEQIVARGFDRSTVQRVAHLVRNSEFKRQQLPPGLKVTDATLGTGWRMPIANKALL